MRFYIYFTKKVKNVDITDVDENTIKVNFNGGNIISKNYTAGDIIGVYVKDIYENVDVNGRTVIDCGAAVRDSAIYFSLRG